MPVSFLVLIFVFVLLCFSFRSFPFQHFDVTSVLHHIVDWMQRYRKEITWNWVVVVVVLCVKPCLSKGVFIQFKICRLTWLIKLMPSPVFGMFFSSAPTLLNTKLELQCSIFIRSLFSVSPFLGAYVLFAQCMRECASICSQRHCYAIWNEHTTEYLVIHSVISIWLRYKFYNN